MPIAMITRTKERTLEEIEAEIEQDLGAVWRVAANLTEIRERKLYRDQGFRTFDDYTQKRWHFGKNYANKLIGGAKVVDNLGTMVPILPTSERQVRPLTSLAPEEQRNAWKRAVETAPKTGITGKHVAQVVRPSFNRTNDNIEWASWSWNPVTGCEHRCEYCYARDIANRFYPQGFKPTFHEHRLKAPMNMKTPKNTNPGDHSVFVCSMADLFGDWVPQNWIDKVLQSVRQAPQWNFIFLTKNPARLIDIEWPSNVWVGTTVDCQERIAAAESAFARVSAPVRFVSCEPFQEPLTFTSLDMFDWVIMGGRSKSSTMPAFQPDWPWVESLILQARRFGCKIYFKPNLTVRPREYP